MCTQAHQRRILYERQRQRYTERNCKCAVENTKAKVPKKKNHGLLPFLFKMQNSEYILDELLFIFYSFGCGMWLPGEQVKCFVLCFKSSCFTIFISQTHEQRRMHSIYMHRSLTRAAFFSLSFTYTRFVCVINKQLKDYKFFLSLAFFSSSSSSIFTSIICQLCWLLASFFYHHFGLKILFYSVCCW